MPNGRLREELVVFFHRELGRRYSLEYLHRIPELHQANVLDDVPEDSLEHIKEFFKRVMYPRGEDRERRDAGMETVASIVDSTSSLIALLPLISGYRLSNRLEHKTLKTLRDLCEEESIDVDAGEEIPERLFRAAYARSSEQDTQRMVKHTGHIVELGMKQGLMKAARDIAETVKETRSDPQEREALDYVISVLGEIYELARSFSKAEIRAIVRMCEITESVYFQRLRQ